ncbi:MAG: glutamine-hydrolyzing GMP synthase [Oligoflexia bacterium]|nr:glutamine-hydrolyzing GMP synthase [Oligoflexia bacterium]
MSITGGIVVLDFGSQFTQLIARRIRELGVYSEIIPFNSSIDEIKKRKPVGIVLSGGPSSVYDQGAPQRNDIRDLLDYAPVLGICYGMQLFAHGLGGKVESSKLREYGRMTIQWIKDKTNQVVWMSHGDLVTGLPEGTEGLAKSSSGHWAAIENKVIGKGFTGLQFHPEVTHTENGKEIIRKFVFEKCNAKINWQGDQLVSHLVNGIKEKVGPKDNVLCALSGGVDSTVTASLLIRALGKERVQCVFVDTGLMRHLEAEQVVKAYKEMDLPVKAVFAENEFIGQLNNIEDPEQKRKIIGRVFIEVFDNATKSFPCQFLAQGTLYPDVIESVNIHGQSVTIKSHHNVGGLPAHMKLKLVEPLRELFKDEVRALGRELGVKPELLNRHPFPGPGLAIRLIGPINKDDLSLLRMADHIFTDELKVSGLYDQIWQAFVVLLPVKTVGVMGDNRTYEKVAALRAVTSIDGMTADWFGFDTKFLAKVSNRITNEVRGINRVVYDISSKPPATIEWE